MPNTEPHLLHPTAKTFSAQVLESDLPVIVDFWAPWCPPCMMFKPEMQKLAAEVAGRAKVAFVNVDEEPALADMFQISSIPAVMIFKDGKRVDAWTGAAPRPAVLERLARHMGQKAAG